MTVTETGDLLALIADAFPGRITLTAGMTKFWAQMLVDLELEDAVSALAEYCSGDNAHPPNVGQLRTLAVRRKLNLPDAAAAWAEVQKAIQRHGRDHEPEWSSPAIAAAVEAMGWRSLCNSLAEDEPVVRAQFRGFLENTTGREERKANIGSLESSSPAVLTLVADVTKKLTGK
jgi:hypothetical protein